MVRFRALSEVAALVLVMVSGTVGGAEHIPKLTDASVLEIDNVLVASEGRPNEESRFAGLKAYQQRDYEVAKQRFEVAALYADKFAQHYLSVMHWHGVGTPIDRATAYVWADLAAERGTPRLLAIREKMWTQLTPEQQRQVQARGREFYDRYGDDVAKSRAEGAMRRFRDGMTGSRTGFSGLYLQTSTQPVGGTFSPPGGSSKSAYHVLAVASSDQLYGDGRRPMANYWKGQDALLGGSVEVGDVERTNAPGQP